jgi:hypothetical protein
MNYGKYGSTANLNTYIMVESNLTEGAPDTPARLSARNKNAG